jgi:hypothetical protein
MRTIDLPVETGELTPADDLLRGVGAIGRFIGSDERATYYKLSKGYISGQKEGGEWISTKSACPMTGPSCSVRCDLPLINSRLYFAFKQLIVNSIALVGAGSANQAVFLPDSLPPFGWTFVVLG